jgi:hypothetical protein
MAFVFNPVVQQKGHLQMSATYGFCFVLFNPWFSKKPKLA